MADSGFGRGLTQLGVTFVQVNTRLFRNGSRYFGKALKPISHHSSPLLVVSSARCLFVYLLNSSKQFVDKILQVNSLFSLQDGCPARDLCSCLCCVPFLHSTGCSIVCKCCISQRLCRLKQVTFDVKVFFSLNAYFTSLKDKYCIKKNDNSTAN